MECPRATERIRIGLPSTTTHATSNNNHTPSIGGASSFQPSNSNTHNPSATQILAATENFITFLDALKLGLLSKDQLHPLLSEVIQSVNRVTDHDFEGRSKIISWLIRLNGMKAQEELGEGEARELAFEMDGAYAGFKAALN